MMSLFDDMIAGLTPKKQIAPKQQPPKHQDITRPTFAERLAQVEADLTDARLSRRNLGKLTDNIVEWGNAQIEPQINQVKNELKELREQMAEIAETNQLAEQLLKEMREHMPLIKESTVALQATTANYTSLTQERDGLKRDRDSVQQERDVLKQECERLQRENAQLQQKEAESSAARDRYKVIFEQGINLLTEQRPDLLNATTAANAVNKPAA